MNCRTYGAMKMEATTMNEKQSDQNDLQMEGAQAAADALDETFGAGTAWTLAGDTDKAVGHAEAHVGHVVGDRSAVIDGVKREAYGTAEQVEGRLEHDYAAAQAKIESDIAALKAKVSTLKAQFTAATGQTRTEVQAGMDAAKARQQAIEARINAEMDQAKAERDAKVASLQQQASQATGEAKAKIAASIDQVRLEYKQHADSLDQTLVDAEQALRA